MEGIYNRKGPVLLLAGPGTGKTYTLGLRLKYLIDEVGISPKEITVITFTAEAAKNMRKRISDPEKEALFLQYRSQPNNILTMHSLGFKIINANHDKVNLPDKIGIITSNLEKTILLGDAAQLSGYKRSDGKEVADCRQLGDCNPVEQPKCKICDKYKELLRKCSSLDYDEQILLAVELLEKFPEIRKEFKCYTKHLLVDEYQDINIAQYKLIKLLSEGQEEGLFVVGDDDQSIYSWRGGSPEFIRNFKKDFGKNSSIVPLNKSYRCHSNILEGSLKIVESFDPSRMKKETFEYEVEEGSKIKIHNAPSDKKEAIIVRKIVQNALPSQDVMILVPQRQFAEAVISELRAYKIGFTTRTNLPGEGLPLISRLNDWLNNTDDSIALRRCIEAFMERIDSTTPSSRVRKQEYKDKREEIFLEIAKLWEKVITGEVNNLWNSIEVECKNDELYMNLWDSFNILLKQYNEEGDIREFAKNVAELISPWRKIKPYLSELVEWVNSIKYNENSGAESNVRIMTFQGAKGLEAKVVCVLGLEEGVIPRGEEEIPEQSRLLFVSMTRAINDLHLFHSRLRSSKILKYNAFVGGKPSVQLSRFIKAIPDRHSEDVYHRA